MKILRIKKLHPKALLPKRGNDRAAGYDLFARLDEPVIIKPGQRAKIPLGFAAQWDDPTYYGRLAPRSGLALNKGVQIMGGVMDEDYRGEWAVIMFNSDETGILLVEDGDKIAQVVFEKYATWDDVVEVDDLEATERGESGYGSTGYRHQEPVSAT
jgi:dUTP pyrophosphatase